MPRLTVLIPCKNERRHIRECIESVRPIADEILVADSGSTDGTLEIVREMDDCRLIEREYVNSADFKNWAIPQARHPWVLVVDADERVTPELAFEINSLLVDTPAQDGYWLRRNYFFLGQHIRRGSWQTATLVRLFRRDAGRYEVRRVHSNVQIPSGKVGGLTQRLDHYSVVDLPHFIARQHRYSAWSALDAFEQGKRCSWLRMLLHAPLRFIQQYVLRGVMFEGTAGLVLCAMQAYYTFLKDAQLWALERGSSAEAVPQIPEKSQPQLEPQRERARVA